MSQAQSDTKDSDANHQENREEKHEEAHDEKHEELFDADGDNDSLPDESKDIVHPDASPKTIKQQTGASSSPSPSGTQSFTSLSRSSSTRAIRESSQSTPSDHVHEHELDHYHDDNLDPESPTFSLISSLRSQITDLTGQVHTLNSKLVNSFHRISDLEDEKDRADQLMKRIGGLEKERQEWNAALEGGTLVERKHVQSELTRLMDKILEESEQRTSAEHAKAAIEGELDQLSSSLFQEANKMVASERMSRAQAEAKLESLETSVQDMRGMLDALRQSLTTEVERGQALEVENSMMRNKFQELNIPLDVEMLDNTAVMTATSILAKRSIDQSSSVSNPQDQSPMFLSYIPVASNSFSGVQLDVTPYDEFLSFIQHLKRARIIALTPPVQSTHATMYYAGPPATAGPPPSPKEALTPLLQISQHASQPFIKRAMEEDADPSLRLDHAPGLNWLSRRAISAAVLDGSLVIEPAHGTLPSSTCSLCGISLSRWFVPGQEVETPAEQAQKQVKKMISSTWNFSRSKKDTPETPSPKEGVFQFPTTIAPPINPTAYVPPPQSQIHICRVGEANNARYTLCPSYCLQRLRAVCQFWGYIRSLERGLLFEEYNFVGAATPTQSSTRPGHSSRPSLDMRRGSALNSYRRTVSTTSPPQNKRLSLIKTRSSSIGDMPLSEKVNREEPSSKSNAVDVRTDKVADLESEADDKADPPPLYESKEDVKVAEKVNDAVARQESNEKTEESKVDLNETIGEDDKKSEVETKVKNEEEDKEAKKDGENNGEEKSAAEKSVVNATNDPPSATATANSASDAEGEPLSRASIDTDPSGTGAPSPGVTPGTTPPPVPKRSAARRAVPPPPSTPPPEVMESANVIPARPPRRHAPTPSVASTIRPKVERNRSGVLTPGSISVPIPDNASLSGLTPGWEKRCWNEIVRLKELMFWSRVAAVIKSK